MMKDREACGAAVHGVTGHWPSVLPLQPLELPPGGSLCRVEEDVPREPGWGRAPLTTPRKGTAKQGTPRVSLSWHKAQHFISESNIQRNRINRWRAFKYRRGCCTKWPRGCCGQHTPQRAAGVAARDPGRASGLCGLHLLVPDRVAAPRVLQPINSLILIYWAILNTLGGRENVTGQAFEICKSQ